jgi:hypothetical protein
MRQKSQPSREAPFAPSGTTGAPFTPSGGGTSEGAAP